jgi:hypothetical protein
MKPPSYPSGAAQEHELAPHRRLIATFGLLAAFAAPAAHAGSAACLWRHLPVAVHEQLFAAYDRSGSEALGSVNIDNGLIQSLAAACARSTSDETLSAVGATLAGVALEESAAHALANRGVSRRRLEAAWTTTPSSDRKAIFDAFAPPPSHTAEDASRLFLAFAHAAERAGARIPQGVSPEADPRFRAYLDFFQGHAQSEVFQTRF